MAPGGVVVVLHIGQTGGVAAGDTLSGIAAKFGTTWQELQRINGIPNANHIETGQTIRLP